MVEVELWITPRDLARIGSYMLATLKSRDVACVAQFLDDAMKPKLKTLWEAKGYGYQLWTDTRGLPQAIGHGGQMLSIDRSRSRIMVVFSAKSNYLGAQRSFHTWLDPQ